MDKISPATYIRYYEARAMSTAALVATRRVDTGSDTILIVTPTYRLEVRVPVSGRPKVVGLVRGRQVSEASMRLTAHQTSHQRRPGWIAGLLWWVAPKVLRAAGCGGCGDTASPQVAVVVPLSIMVGERKDSCLSCAIYRRRWRWFSICPRPLGGCGCLLNIKWRVPWSRCPAGRW